MDVEFSKAVEIITFTAEIKYSGNLQSPKVKELLHEIEDYLKTNYDNLLEFKRIRFIATELLCQIIQRNTSNIVEFYFKDNINKVYFLTKDFIPSHSKQALIELIEEINLIYDDRKKLKDKYKSYFREGRFSEKVNFYFISLMQIILKSRKKIKCNFREINVDFVEFSMIVEINLEYD